MKRLITLISLACILFAVTCVYAQDISLNGKWMFKPDYNNIGYSQKWFSPSTDISGWDRMDVPGCWNTRREYSLYTGTAWYQTKFTYNEELKGDDLFLFFEAVYSDAEVWLNGVKLGSHDFGFTSFQFDVTKLIKQGFENTIAVKVSNTFKLGATWNWGGIRRPVSLHRLPSQRIERVFVATEPNLKKRSAEVSVRTELHNVKDGTVFLKIKDASQKIVATSKQKIASGTKEQLLSCRIDKVNLWGFDSPYLYTAEVSLEKEGKPVHSTSTRFGVRKIEIDGYKLLLNGESVRLNGANYVPDERFTGSTLPEKVFRKDIDLMKECGVNMARLSHLGLPQEVLDYIDEKGMLIFEEIPLWNRNKLIEANHPTPMKWLTELITQRYNHPCIIGWSAGNEIGRFNDNPHITEYLTSAFKHIRELDPTRLAIYVTHTAARQENEPAELSDIIMFNQYGAPGFHGERAEIAHRNYPSKPIFYCEYGHKINSDNLNNNTTDFAGLAEGMRGYEYVIGAAIWTFNDYRTNYRDNATAATQNRPWGVVDVYRNKKRGYSTLQRENSPVKKLELNITPSNHIVEGEITLLPREILDLPAFDLRGYSLMITANDINGNRISKQAIALPEIKVGSHMRSFKFNLKEKEIAKVTVDLVSPVGYAVDSRNQSILKPTAPMISHAEAAQYRIRIHFDRHPSATQWYAKYGIDHPDQQTPPTINDYLEFGNLEFGKEYTVQLVAVNDCGETTAKEVVKIKTLAAELPPIICHLQQHKDEIRVGYLSENWDFIYEFEYGTDPQNLSQSILTTDAGACILPAEEGSSYYLRIRKRINYGYESQWSKVYKVMQ
ncbi:glycoside hydrolase family 2 protein [Bacteroides oleiciplenus]|uniref:Beta-galactosidase n=1 Tax=Bacteroides oleiciplenus TaxID=626931 RepID=A0A3E5BFS2_9BACE|nr:glycoside hydrolase family 2 TIM barrel-domain containing protein [Bacteroides oleiciplenus]RGN36441.1 hypothetical protein DXB65_08530 [Bacteroides oleiciplenus]